MRTVTLALALALPLALPTVAFAEDLDGDGWTTEEGDCDDEDPLVHPGARQLCDGIDNDCDGLVDEGCDSDLDGDLIPDALDDDADGDGFIGVDWGGDDCDDLDATVYPGAPELCDGKDNDCDGLIDNDCVDTDEPDTDAPDTDEPDTDAPDTGEPDTDAPDTGEPDTDAPDTDLPGDTGAPGDADPVDELRGGGCSGAGGTYAFLMLLPLTLVGRRRR